MRINCPVKERGHAILRAFAERALWIVCFQFLLWRWLPGPWCQVFTQRITTHLVLSPPSVLAQPATQSHLLLAKVCGRKTPARQMKVAGQLEEGHGGATIGGASSEKEPFAGLHTGMVWGQWGPHPSYYQPSMAITAGRPPPTILAARHK